MKLRCGKGFFRQLLKSGRRDLLVPQDVRERKGSFFTPKIWVEKSQQYLADVLGENWQDEYYIWDCCAGTGNKTDASSTHEIRSGFEELKPVAETSKFEKVVFTEELQQAVDFFSSFRSQIFHKNIKRADCNDYYCGRCAQLAVSAPADRVP